MLSADASADDAASDRDEGALAVVVTKKLRPEPAFAVVLVSGLRSRLIIVFGSAIDSCPKSARAFLWLRPAVFDSLSTVAWRAFATCSASG